MVGDAVAVAAEPAAERFLAEPLAVPAGFGQDARGGCDDLAVEVRVLAAVRLPTVRGLCFLLRFLRRCGSWLRLAGHKPVPAIYGPSGDVKWDEADPTYSLEAAKRGGTPKG